MDDPELHGDEEILLRTNGVHVKSISFEAILTNKRIILIDRIKNVLPPKEIPLATVKFVEPAENAIRDLIISLGIITKTGGTRKMVLTFSREGGGNRLKERDEWIRQIRAHLTPSLEQVIRKVMPEMDTQPAPQRMPGSTQKAKKAVDTLPKEPVTAPAPVPSKEPESVLGTYCTRCGTKVPEGSGFCNKCGNRIILPGEGARQPVAAPAPSVPVYTAPISRQTSEDIGTIEPLIEKSSATVPRDPLRSVPPVQRAGQPAQPAPAQPIKAAPKAAAPAKKRFIPRLFSPKDLPPTPLVPSSMPTAAPPAPKKPRNTKKILLVAGIIVILLVAVVAVVMVLPKLGSLGTVIPGSGSSAAATTTTAPVVTTTKATSGSGTAVVAATKTPVSIPQSGVYLYANYLGGWKATYGTTGSLVTKTNSGERIIEIANATGTVTASVLKLDSSSHELTVTIYKDGKALTTGSTTAPNGKVALSVDVTTGVAQAPVVSGSTGTATTVATTKIATTNTTTAATK